MAQDEGYLILTSTQIKDGTAECAATCTTDADCGEDRCIDAFLDGAGQPATRICGQRRFGHVDLTAYRRCDASLCSSSQACLRSPPLQELERFAEHKRNRGFSVHVFTEDAWGGGVGDVAAENLRTWLMTIAPSTSAKYVLLIGDPSPTSGPLPMKQTWPEHNAQQTWATPNAVVPTDYYYADLHGDWDLDQDGFVGEWGSVNLPEDQRGDFGPGGIDRIYDLKVGRIPWYQASDSAAVDHILVKTMTYQNAEPEMIAWRRSALIATEGENRFFFGEAIRSDLLEPNGYGSHRVYDADCIAREAAGGRPCMSPIDGQPEALECNPQNVLSGWNGLQPGMVFWLTHGSGQGAVSVMNSALTTMLDDTRPTFTFQASCYNSQPELRNNVSYALLKNGSINTIGATRISHGPGSPVSLPNTAGNAGMAYEYARRMIVEEQNSGTALMELKQNLPLQNRWWYWKNLCDFNIYGDPEVGLQDVRVEPPAVPDAGVAMEPDALVLPDAAAVVDAGVVMDAAAAPVRPDAQAMTSPDAQPGPAPQGEDDRCSCRTTTTSGGRPLSALLLIGLVGALRARRRPTL